MTSCLDSIYIRSQRVNARETGSSNPSVLLPQGVRVTCARREEDSQRHKARKGGESYDGIGSWNKRGTATAQGKIGIALIINRQQ
jgi:hypothetical protein